jgi:hypothetical protein
MCGVACRSLAHVTQRIARAAQRRTATPMVPLTDESRNARNLRHTISRHRVNKSGTLQDDASKKTSVETGVGENRRYSG